jgi:oxygen-independent coproporphyrinogen III oxidase
MVDTFESVRAAASSEMSRAYARIPDRYWEGRSARNFRFDNLSELVRMKPAVSPLDREGLEDALRDAIASSPVVSIYAGVPWCVQSCPFCDLAYARNPNVETQLRYIETLHSEVEHLAAMGLGDKTVSSLYFGGGTPTVLKPDLLERYVKGVLAHFPRRQKAVITCEASPATLTRPKLEYLSTVANRLSLGVQTLDTPLRKAEGRLLTREAALEKIELALGLFKIVNCDVLYGLREQSLESFYETVKDLIDRGVPSITLYRLELHPGTWTYQQEALDSWPAVQERHAREFYFLGRWMLEASGYIEDPLGWFIKTSSAPAPGVALTWSDYVNRWRKVTPYLGVGQGSFSTTPGFWMRNARDLPGWEAAVCDGRVPNAEFVPLDEMDQFLVRLMRVIRSVRSIDRGLLLSDFPGDPSDLVGFLDRLAEFGLTESDGDAAFSLTSAGRSLVHGIIADAVAALTLSGCTSASPARRPEPLP